jgi:hypothetical protein
MLVPLAGVSLAAACRYYLIWGRFRIPEHLMMAAGMVISSVGCVVFSPVNIVSFLLGCGILAWGVGLWFNAQVEILGNLKWRSIRKGHSRTDIWLLRFGPAKGV